MRSIVILNQVAVIYASRASSFEILGLTALMQDPLKTDKSICTIKYLEKERMYTQHVNKRVSPYSTQEGES